MWAIQTIFFHWWWMMTCYQQGGKREQHLVGGRKHSWAWRCEIVQHMHRLFTWGQTRGQTSQNSSLRYWYVSIPTSVYELTLAHARPHRTRTKYNKHTHAQGNARTCERTDIHVRTQKCACTHACTFGYGHTRTLNYGLALTYSTRQIFPVKWPSRSRRCWAPATILPW